MIRNNIRLVQANVTKAVTDMDELTRLARNEIAMASVQRAKKQIQGVRPYTTVKRTRDTSKGKKGSSYRVYAKAESGKPPMNRTSMLRKSIHAEYQTQGFAHYTATVGPGMPYARQVELGGGNWGQGVRFPYMEPAYVEIITQVMPQIRQKFFRRFG